MSVHDGSTISIINGKVDEISVGKLTVAGTIYVQIEADLANLQMDRLEANAVTLSAGSIVINDIQVLSHANKTHTTLSFTDNSKLAGITSIHKAFSVLHPQPDTFYTTSFDPVTGDITFVKYVEGYDPGDYTLL